MRIEPRLSVPIATEHRPAATAAAAPPDEPPADTGTPAVWRQAGATLDDLRVAFKRTAGTETRWLWRAPDDAIDAMRVGDDMRLHGLPKDYVQPDDGGAPGSDDVAQHIACAHAGQLIDIAHQQQMRVEGHGFQQMIHQQQIDHAGFVDDEQIDFQRILRVALEAFLRRIFQQPMEGLGRSIGGLAQSFGGASRRRGERIPVIELLEQIDHGAHGCGLAGARAAGEHGDFVLQRGAHGVLLLIAEAGRGPIRNDRAEFVQCGLQIDVL